MTAVLKRLPDGTLREIDAATTFVGLAERLKAVDDFHGVDPCVGAYVEKGEGDIAGIYRRLLACLEPWVVAGTPRRIPNP
jgi:hypothetical protein